MSEEPDQLENHTVHLCRLWLYRNHELNLRNRLNEVSAQKEEIKTRLAEIQTRFEEEEAENQTILNDLQSQEAAMRVDLDDVSHEIFQLETASGDREKIEEEIERRKKLWETLELLIERRNVISRKLQMNSDRRQVLNKLNSSNATINATSKHQSLNISSSSSSHRQQKRSHSAGLLFSSSSTSLQVDMTPKMPGVAEDTLTSRGSTDPAYDKPLLSDPRDFESVKWLFDDEGEYIVSLIKKLDHSRSSEHAVRSELMQSLATREQITQSYHARMSTTDGDEEKTLSSSLSKDGVTNPTLETLDYTIALDRAKDRRVLNRMCEEIIKSGLVSDRQSGSTVMPHCFVGSEVELWLLKCGVFSKRESASVFIQLLVSFGLVDVVRSISERVGFQYVLYRFRKDPAAKASRSKGGWLEKVCKWRKYRRYFVWDEKTNRLSYFLSNRAMGKPRRVYWLSGKCTIKALEPRAMDSSMKLLVGETKAYLQINLEKPQNGETSLLLAASSPEDRKEWLRILWLSGCHYPRQTEVQQKKAEAIAKQLHEDHLQEDAPLNRNRSQTVVDVSFEVPIKIRQFDHDDSDVDSDRNSSSWLRTEARAKLQRAESDMKRSFDVARARNQLAIAAAFSSFSREQTPVLIGRYDQNSEQTEHKHEQRRRVQDKIDCEVDAKEEDTNVLSIEEKLDDVRAALTELLQSKNNPAGSLLAHFISMFCELYSFALKTPLSVDLPPEPPCLNTSTSSRTSTASVLSQSLPLTTSPALQSPTQPTDQKPDSQLQKKRDCPYVRQHSATLPNLTAPKFPFPSYLSHVLKVAVADLQSFMTNFVVLVCSGQGFEEDADDSADESDGYNSDESFASQKEVNNTEVTPYQLKQLCQAVLQQTIFDAVYDVIFPLYVIKESRNDRDLRATIKNMAHTSLEAMKASPEFCLDEVLAQNHQAQPHSQEFVAAAAAAKKPNELFVDYKTASQSVQSPTSTSSSSTSASSASAFTDLEAETLGLDLEEPTSSSSSSSDSTPNGRSRLAYARAIEKLRSVVDLKDPSEKVEIITELPNEICACIDEFRACQDLCKGVTIQADDLIILFAWLFVQADIPHVQAELRFMNDFLSEDSKKLMVGYYHATAVASIETLFIDPDAIEPGFGNEVAGTRFDDAADPA